MLVQIALFDGFDLLDALAPYEVFAAAGMYSGGAIKAELVSAEGARLVTSGTNGLQVAAGGGIDLERAGVLLVPGASGDMSDGPDSVVPRLHRASETRLTELAGTALKRPGLTVATVCGGSLLLAMAGLLEGRHAVTNRLGMGALGATGAIPVNARVVDDGNLVTAGGVTSGLDAALYLVERELGPLIAREVELLFEYERRGTVWEARGMVPVSSMSKREGGAIGWHWDDSAAGSRSRTEAGSRAVRMKAGVGADSRTVDTNAEVGADSRVAGPYEEIKAGGSATGLSDEPGTGTSAAGSLFEGEWQAVIATPLGKQQVVFRIARNNGMIRGTATQGDETVEFEEPSVSGNTLAWSQRVTKPMRLNLRFEVTVQGDTMTGVAKAGMLPASKVAGERKGPRGEAFTRL